MSEPTDPAPANGRSRQFQRAKLRHLFLTSGPDRLTRGLLRRRHLSQYVDLREIELDLTHWPESCADMRIAHVSDLHVGDLLPVHRAVEIVDAVADLEPDIVVCTGDVVDLENSVAPPVLEAMAQIRAPLGTILVLGNHDYLDDGDELARMAAASGLTVLRNTSIDMPFREETLRVAGADWGRTVRECTGHVRRAVNGHAHLLLAHNPKSFIEAARMGIPLTLAGHTHGGQLAGGRKARYNLAMAHRRNRGLYRHGESHLYVTTGVGAWFPLRVNCPAEIALITVRRLALE